MGDIEAAGLGKGVELADVRSHAVVAPQRFARNQTPVGLVNALQDRPFDVFHHAALLKGFLTDGWRRWNFP